MHKTLLVLATFGLAACATAPVDTMTEPRTLGGTLQATTGNENVRGAVSVNAAPRTTGASISIAGAQSGGTHPWHIHQGRCGSPGAIVGDANAYPVLRVGPNGNASAQAVVRTGLRAGESYSVNVHRSPTEMNNIIACVNL